MTNSGMEDEVTPSSTIARSDFLSLRRAANRPAVMASGIVMRRARPASLAELIMAATSWGRTGEPFTNESPKSSVNTPTIESDVLDEDRAVGAQPLVDASTLSCGANGPRIVRPTSFGRTLAMTNTIVASSQIVSSERSSLRVMKRAIGSSRRG